MTIESVFNSLSHERGSMASTIQNESSAAGSCCVDRVPSLTLWIQALATISLGMVVSLNAAESDPFTLHEPPALVGRWDLQMRDGESTYPSWLEMHQSGFRTLVGSYVGQFGSVRPIGEIIYHRDKGDFHFAVPPQWERRTSDIVFKGVIEGDVLKGETTNDEGGVVRWEGRRAPLLISRGSSVTWGDPINLFNGKDLTGWIPRHADLKHGWKVREGLLANVTPGNDLMTQKRFGDFKLHAEFRYPKGSNSGIYLRGRHEVQIEDNYGLPADSHRIGGVYGFLLPRINAAKKAGEWQTLEITLIGRVVTIVLNGEPIIERQVIPGITGGALDSDEGQLGPILIQGDHGPIEFRALTLTPAS